MELKFIGLSLLSLMGIILSSFFRVYFSRLVQSEDSIRKINSFVARVFLNVVVFLIVAVNIFIFLYEGYFNLRPMTRSDVADLIISGLTMTLCVALGTLYYCVNFIGKRRNPASAASDPIKPEVAAPDKPDSQSP